MVKKKGTHASDWIWCVVVSQNGTGHMFRTTKGTHSSELTWCAGISKNRADL